MAYSGYPDHKARPIHAAPKWVKMACHIIQVTRGITGYGGYPESKGPRPNCFAPKWHEFGDIIVLPGGFVVHVGYPDLGKARPTYAALKGVQLLRYFCV